MIAGTLPAVAGQALGTIDIAAAQDRFGRLGRIDRIDLKLADGADRAQVRAAIAAILPGDAVLASAADDASRTDALSRAYRVNLDMLALVALLTGAFLVYSAQALSIARRRPHFALLRVLGASRRLVLTQLLAEGLILGVIGSVIGILLGLAIAAAVLRLVGGDLGSGYFSGESAPRLLFAPGAALGFAALGIAAALIGGLLPAYQAARMAPMVALKNLGDAIDPRRRPRIAPALLLAFVGIGFAMMPAVGGIALFGYGAVGLLLAAGIAAMPWLARTLLAPLARHSFASPAMGLAVEPTVGSAEPGGGGAVGHRRERRPDDRDGGDGGELPRIGRPMAGPDPVGGSLSERELAARLSIRRHRPGSPPYRASEGSCSAPSIRSHWRPTARR